MPTLLKGLVKVPHFVSATVVAMVISLAQAEEAVTEFNITPQPLAEAILKFSKATHIVVTVSPELIAELQAPAISGSLLPSEALARLLAQTGLEYVFASEHAVILRKAKNKPEHDNAAFSTMPEEIIVTANKRGVGINIQDTAMAISALNSDGMRKKNLTSMKDYLISVPGTSMLDFGVGKNAVVIRGMATDPNQQSTSSIYLGEVPLTNPTVTSGTDIKLIDMESVEVLRGPQGTLYGSGSLSGTVRNLPTAPNLTEIEGSVELGYSNTAESNGDNTKFVGIVNLPIVSDTLAIRAAAYSYNTAGYVDFEDFTPTTTRNGLAASTEQDIGDNTYTGARLIALWNITENLDATLMLGTQKLEEDGRNEELVNRDDPYEAVGFQTGKEFREENFDYRNLVITYSLPWGSLTSSTSHIDGTTEEGSSQSRFLPTTNHFDIDNEKNGITQEIRFSSEFEGALQTLVGVFYEDFESIENLDMNAVIGMPGGTTGIFDILGLTTKREFTQLALFGEVYYTVTDVLQLTAGARFFDYDRTDEQIGSGYADSVAPADIDESSETFKFVADYRMSEDWLVYGSWAQGFRIGKGQTALPANQCDTELADGSPGSDGLLDGTSVSIAPEPLKSDSTTNFEFGSKITALDRRFTLNTALYHIKWQDIPVPITSTNLDCPFTVELNLGEAQSQGVEIETRFSVTPDLVLSLMASYVDTEFLDDSIGQKGSRLLYAPRVNGNFDLQYNFTIADKDSYAKFDITYVGDYLNDIGGTRPKSGDYVTLGFRTGISLGQFDVDLFGTNLTGEEETTTIFFGNQGWRQQPRTVGIDASYNF